MNSNIKISKNMNETLISIFHKFLFNYQKDNFKKEKKGKL